MISFIFSETRAHNALSAVPDCDRKPFADTRICAYSKAVALIWYRALTWYVLRLSSPRTHSEPWKAVGTRRVNPNFEPWKAVGTRAGGGGGGGGGGSLPAR